MYLVKRHQIYWALHDVPKALQGKLGRRLAKSLETGNKLEAERKASLLWLHDWSHKLAGGGRRTEDSQAFFYRELVRNAETEREREAITSHLADIYSDRDYAAQERGDAEAANANFRQFKIATGRLTPLSEHLDAWMDSVADTPKTKAMKRAEVLKLEKAHPYAEEVTAEVASKWIAGLGKQASAKTIGRILSFLRGYWKYLRAQDVLKADPFAGLSPPSTARRRASWVPFTATQVVDLRKQAAAGGDHELADLITLAMWSGARIEELCSLEIPNVDLQAKAFKVVDAKTEAGLREVPIHPKVLPTFRRLIGKRREGCVLAHLSSNKFGDRSNAIGKRFGRLKSDAKFGAGHVFHSIRKTVVTLLENAGTSENVAADIVGHEKPRITYGLYSGGASLEVKRKALAKLRYPAG
ncbi:tyrosine-type recombinase/integrase [Reyranella sp.]|uniref:tyrosine-type recombinase/integrase n=1 Tax=Reyranella sp. TaxID=1929291 RepID=UPI0025D922A4|nr:tyrosine-type recombinase/integrase [Reyranella sp.]